MQTAVFKMSKVIVIVLLLSIATNIFAATNTKSLSLDRSSNESVSISDASAGLDLSNSFTLETWVKPLSIPGNNVNYSIFTQWGGSSYGFVFTYTNQSGVAKLRLVAQNAANNASVEKYLDYDLGVGIWRHVALSYDSIAGTAEVFIDGYSIGVMTGLPTVLNNSTADIVIGHDGNYGAGSSFDGLIDEVRVWGVTRTQPEVLGEMFDVLSASTTNLNAYWRFENNYNDSSGNGKTLSGNNTPTYSDDPAHKLTCGLSSIPVYTDQASFNISCTVFGIH